MMAPSRTGLFVCFRSIQGQFLQKKCRLQGDSNWGSLDLNASTLWPPDHLLAQIKLETDFELSSFCFRYDDAQERLATEVKNGQDLQKQAPSVAGYQRQRHRGRGRRHLKRDLQRRKKISNRKFLPRKVSRHMTSFDEPKIGKITPNRTRGSKKTCSCDSFIDSFSLISVTTISFTYSW